jgi:prolyl-tRNA synthetase
VPLPAGRDAPELVQTPGATTIDALVGSLGVPAGATLKAFPIVIDGDEMKMVVVRGDHRVNEIKLQNALGRPFRAARADEIEQRIGPPGYIGPVGAGLPVLLDAAVTANGAGSYVAGANEPDAHLRGVQPGRDFNYENVDVRTVVAGDTVGGSPIRIEPAIEVGNIFKLGTRYSDPLGATYLDENGKAQHVWMGSYGFGPARTAAAAVEQFADEEGISWPRNVAPFDVELVTLGKPGSEERTFSDALYRDLQATGLAVLYDDRDAGPGEKFTDAELLGCPLRLTVGRRTLAAGEIEVQVRRGREGRTVPVEGAADAVAELWRELP